MIYEDTKNAVKKAVLAFKARMDLERDTGYNYLTNDQINAYNDILEGWDGLEMPPCYTAPEFYAHLEKEKLLEGYVEESVRLIGKCEDLLKTFL